MSLPERALPPTSDVRMRGFSHRATVEDAWAWIDGRLQMLDPESVSLWEAAGRVLACDIRSQVDVPAFHRAMMDGYAVQAENTHGATPYNPLRLAIVGEAMPGTPFQEVLRPGQAVRIMTGAPVPGGADAVLPAELAQTGGGQVLVQGEVSPAKHVGTPGEDIRSGTKVLSRGRLLRPQDVGLLSSIGMSQVPVVRKVRVAIRITGSELLSAGEPPHGYRIADANGPMLASLVRRDGGTVTPGSDQIVRDDRQAILHAMQADADVVLVSGGSSVGQEDFAPQLLAAHGQLAIHGIAIRPSSPAGMGTLDDRLVFLLPGNPVSCLCGYDFFAGRAIRGLAGRSSQWPYRTCRLPLRRKLISQIGRVDYARVAIIDGGVEPLAIGGASVLSSTTRGDGFVIVPADREGIPLDTEVEVHLYDETGR